MIEKIIRYRHVIWDWNGTLLDDVWLVVEIMNKILKKRNLPKISSEKYKEIFDFPVINYYSKLGFDFSNDSFEKLATEFVSEYDKRCIECKLCNEVEEVLKIIRDMGISQSILSASKEDSLIEKVKYYGIERYFCRIIGLKNHYAESKIKRGKNWIAELNLNPQEVLFIGDTTHDYEVSKHIGCDCLLIANGHHSYEKLASLGIDVISTLKEINQV